MVGHSLHFLRDCHRLMDTRRARFGDVSRTELLGRTVVVFLTPQATKEIYLDRDRCRRARAAGRPASAHCSAAG